MTRERAKGAGRAGDKANATADFTLGPFFTSNVPGDHRIRNREGRAVAIVLGCWSPGVSPEEIEAIKALLAAAPELYEALQGLEQALKCGEPIVINDKRHQARAVLAKGRPGMISGQHNKESRPRLRGWGRELVGAVLAAGAVAAGGPLALMLFYALYLAFVMAGAMVVNW